MTNAVELLDDLDAGVDGQLRVQNTTPDAELFKEELEYNYQKTPAVRISKRLVHLQPV